MINRRWLPLNALRAFEAVGQHLSFTAGAQALHVSQSALSRHVISLEEILGKQLLERRPHRLVLTEAGAALLPVVRKSLDRLEQTLNLIREGGTRERTLRVHIPPSLLNELALPLLTDFRAEFPDILIDIASTHVTGLPDEELDVAIVYDRPHVDDRVTDLLWMVRVSPVCAPALAERHAGKSIDAFLADNELLHVKLVGQPRGLLWGAFARQHGVAIDPDRGLAFDTAMSVVQLAEAGAGVALVDIDMFAKELAKGALVRPFDLMSEDGYGYFVKFHPEDLADPVIGFFRHWIISRFTGGEADRTFGRGSMAPPVPDDAIPGPRHDRAGSLSTR